MQYLTNEEIVRLGRLVRKINLAGADNSASDLEEVERGLARLDNSGLIMVMLVACNLEGKPFIFAAIIQKPKIGVGRSPNTWAYRSTRLLLTTAAAELCLDHGRLRPPGCLTRRRKWRERIE